MRNGRGLLGKTHLRRGVLRRALMALIVRIVALLLLPGVAVAVGLLLLLMLLLALVVEVVRRHCGRRGMVAGRNVKGTQYARCCKPRGQGTPACLGAWEGALNPESAGLGRCGGGAAL